MGFAVAAKGATSPADAAIQRYQRCGSDSGCIAAARAEMLGVQQEMRAAGVPLQERVSSGINANIAQASVLLGEMDAALQATGAVGITSLTNQAGGGKTKGATETVRVGELIATHGKTMSNKQLDKLIK
ncbi:MAG: hypothetical protein L6Q68_05355, partial [Aquabacterium sp.]|nr:hypothetical protein [Aquabacterium sp.]